MGSRVRQVRRLCTTPTGLYGIGIPQSAVQPMLGSGNLPFVSVLPPSSPQSDQTGGPGSAGLTVSHIVHDSET